MMKRKIIPIEEIKDKTIEEIALYQARFSINTRTCSINTSNKATFGVLKNPPLSHPDMFEYMHVKNLDKYEKK